MIIIEGPDGAGKSTLAQRLSDELHVPLFHSGGPAITKKEIFARMDDILTRMRQHECFIYDRLPLISDCAYGPPTRGWTPFREMSPFLVTWERVYRDKLISYMPLVVPIIYCRPPVDIIHVNSRRNQSEKATRTNAQPKTPDQIARILEVLPQIIVEYDVMMGDYPHWTYDYTCTTSTIDAPQLINLIRRRLP